jgi:hypothetical protein
MGMPKRLAAIVIPLLDSTAKVIGVILPNLGQGVSGAALHVFRLAVG